MSGNNQNGYAESRRLLLGLGDIYINNEFVGNLKGSVTLTVTRNYVYQRAGNNIADQKGEVTSEEIMLTAEVCDLKVDQLRRAFGIDEAVVTEAKDLRKRDILVLTKDANAPTSPAEEIVSGVKVSSLDRKTLYVSGTDYRLSGSPFDIVPITAGTLVSGDSYIVEYNFTDSGAKATLIGGETKTPNTFEMIFTHQDSKGKYWQVRFYKAMVNTDFSMAFNERESGDWTVHNISFKALVDTTKQEGKNLAEITQEDATA